MGKVGANPLGGRQVEHIRLADRPFDSMPFSQREALHFSHSMLKDLSMRLLGQLDVEDCKALEAAFHAEAISIGTICSGSESPVLTMHSLISAMNQMFQMNASMRHRFGCEINRHKQAFILEMMPDIEALFSDAAALRFARATCARSGKACPVPRCRVLIAGFPCKDVSALNPHSKEDEHRRIIESGGKTTGSCLWSVLHYLDQEASHGEDVTQLVILEMWWAF